MTDLSSCTLFQLPQVSLLGTTHLFLGSLLASDREGSPTLTVWPKVALAALGGVDDHGAVPTAAVPLQPVGLIGAPVDPFLGVVCAGADRRAEKTQEDECCVEVCLFPL